MSKKICAFSFNRFGIFGEFQQENSYISASDERILDQRPDLDRLLNYIIMLLGINLDLRAKYCAKKMCNV
jgi:hypothetical protein